MAEKQLRTGSERIADGTDGTDVRGATWLPDGGAIWDGIAVGPGNAFNSSGLRRWQPPY
jgi:hypothetical protein